MKATELTGQTRRRLIQAIESGEMPTRLIMQRFNVTGVELTKLRRELRLQHKKRARE